MKYKLIILVGLGLSLFSIWAHHMFMSGVNPFISNFFVIPLVIIFLVGIIYLNKKIGEKFSNSVARLFGIGFVSFLSLSALTGVFFGNSAIDIQLHDTYFVIAHFHIQVLFSLIFGFYAIVYFVTPKLIKRKLNDTLGQIHFWLSTSGVFFLMYPIYHLGMVGIPRRYYNVEQLDSYKQFGNINIVITIIVILLLLSQVILLVNLVYSLLKSPKIEI